MNSTVGVTNRTMRIDKCVKVRLAVRVIAVAIISSVCVIRPCEAFTVLDGGNAVSVNPVTSGNSRYSARLEPRVTVSSIRRRTNGNGRERWSAMRMAEKDDSEKSIPELEEEARLLVLTDRRKTVRGILRSAEALKNFRVNNGYVPEIDLETGKPLKSDSKLALTLTAFVVAAGAVTLRVGGRAALVSGLGIDFANENPELKQNMDTFLAYAASLPPATEGLLFVAAWTAVKVFCVDFGGVILALSSGVLFGGVLQGAVASAAAATIGSSVAFFLAKAETPVRRKALEIVDEYPSLRGIERVVAQDGLKAILTLRLAPVLPIPIGMYNYVYGVTNVNFTDFAGGVFLGSLKPYLLDSYLGVFGKQVVDGTAGDAGGIQDVILLVVLGVSVLIGVFASQLAGETWDSVTSEVEAQKQLDKQQNDPDNSSADDGIVRDVMGLDLPLWIVGMQLSLQAATERVEDMLQVEYNAQVWNYTTPEEQSIPSNIDPAKAADSPELLNVGSGFDFLTNICEGIVLSPALLTSFFRYADPLYIPESDDDDEPKPDGEPTVILQEDVASTATPATATTTTSTSIIPQTNNDENNNTEPTQQPSSSPSDASITREQENEMLLNILCALRNSTQTKLQQVDNEIKSLDSL